MIATPPTKTANYIIFTVEREFKPKSLKGRKVKKKFELWYRMESGKISHYPECLQKRYEPLKECLCEREVKNWLYEKGVG